MRKLRKVIASDPCEQQWAQTRKDSSLKSSSEAIELSPSDCVGNVLGYGPGLLEVFVTRHYPDRDRGMVVYLPCGHDEIPSVYKQHVKPKWQRYLYDVANALGGKSFIEACHCGQSNNLRDKNKPAVYIAFERLEEGNVLLRITNNSQWPINVPTASGCISAQSNTGPCRDLGIMEVSDGSRVMMRYRVEGDAWLPPYKASDDEAGARVEWRARMYHFVGNAFTRLPSGNSALFFVAWSYLKDRDIYVPFLYDWDNQPEMFDDANRMMRDPNLEHRVYFRSYDLTQALTKTK